MKKSLFAVLCVVLSLLLCACFKSEEVKRTEAAIEAIGAVTLDSGDAIEEAEAMYDALSSEDQADVENLDILEEAREEYNDLLVDDVQNKISAIGTVTIDSRANITEARTAYDNLPKNLQKNVDNYNTLVDAENEFEFVEKLDANTIKNYTTMNASTANAFDTTLNTWYTDSDARATLLILFLLRGNTDGIIDFSERGLTQEYAAINRADGRIDLYAPYGDDQIMGIQYWPEKGTAQIGTVTTDLDITDYLDLMVEGGIVDEYAYITPASITKILNLLS